MEFKIAVASSDGKVVNQHFGHCRQFMIFDADSKGQWNFSEIRHTVPACSMGEHNESVMADAINAIADCRMVVVSQIGQGALEALENAGVKAYVLPGLIYSALNKVISPLIHSMEKVDYLNSAVKLKD